MKLNFIAIADDFLRIYSFDPIHENFIFETSFTLRSFNFFERIPREKNLSFSIFGFNRPSPGEEKKGAKKERARSCEISERVKSSATRRQRVRMESKGKWFSKVHELTKTTPPLFLAVIGRLTCRLSARVPQDRLL